MTNTDVFHALHHGPGPLILPNAWDFGSAAMLAAAGFPAVATTSLGVAVAAGLADGEGATRAETLALATRLARLPIPVTVDIEAGFSENPGEVAEFVAELAELGIAGVNLEDARANTALAAPEHHAALIATVKARTPGIFVNARTDTYWQQRDEDSTIDRAHRYEQAGADGIFVPGLTAPDRIEKFVAAVPLPLNLLYSATGPSLTTLTELGVARISTGSLLYRAALGTVADLARTILDDRPVTPTIPSYRDILALTGA
ncbi:isocitrate lyase/phosphoenolpyruvate mutase family protein [Nocardia sp. NPDC127526]|uniref:isocitrate lyase/PEP mutase family protein n=1 Tax=Nocardia sp. NPDC127526 TaxID=3345393 RepID=UPI0036250D40